MKKETKLFKDCPVFLELDPSTNDTTVLGLLPYNSLKKVSWVCKKEHKWEAPIYDRASSRPRGCPYCAGNILISGYNDLFTSFPIIAKEWHPTKNINLTPHTITKTSKEKVWWLCDNGHEWKMSVNFRTYNNVKCKICTNIKNGNIGEIYPETINIWDFSENKGLTPFDVARGSKKKYWWICKEGHSTEKLVRNVINGLNCEVCYANLFDQSHLKKLINIDKNQSFDLTKISVLNKEKFHWICENKHEWVNTIKAQMERKFPCIPCSRSLLFHFPELAILFNYERNAAVNPHDISLSSTQNLWWKCQNNHEWMEMASTLKNRKGCKWCNKSIINTHPIIASHWHPTKNSHIRIEDFSIKNSKGIWWKCKNNHEWFSQVLKFNHDCHIFDKEQPTILESKSIPAIEKNVATQSLEETRKIFLHPTKNLNLDASSLKSYSSEKVHWACINGHEWVAGFAYQQKHIDTCKKCETNLLNNNSALAKLWHPSKNGSLTPFNVSQSSVIRVWWKCRNDHEWENTVYNENIKKEHCKFCQKHEYSAVLEVKEIDRSKRKRPESIEMLSAHELFGEVCRERNKGIDIFSITKRSNIKIWWKCANDHEWFQEVNYRTAKNNTCKQCNLTFAKREPELLEQWHPTKNLPMTPDKFFPNESSAIIWFICERNHEWSLEYNKKFLSKKACNFCKVEDSGESLFQKNSALTKEWHPTKNFSLTPKMVHIGSTNSVWWKCNQGHEWEASIKNRNAYESGCRVCTATVNGNVLQNEILAKEWNYLKNISMDPGNFPHYSSVRVWWICEKRHEWQATIRSRSLGHSCVKCSKAGTSKIESKFRNALKYYLPDLRDCPEKLKISWRTKNYMIVDMLSEENKIVIEYDGIYYHSGERSQQTEAFHILKDSQKTEKLLESGYTVIRIREKGLPFLNICDGSLLQVAYNYGATYGQRYGEGVEELVEEIIEWLTKS